MISPESRSIRSKRGRMYVFKKIVPIPTGIEALDRLTVRNAPEMKPGVDLPGIYMIGGGPGTGKTLLALTLAYKAFEQGAAVIYFTFEETTSELLTAAEKIGLDLIPALEDGRFVIVEYSPKWGLSDEAPFVLSPQMIKNKDPNEAIVGLVNDIISRLDAYAYLVLIIDSLPALTSMDPELNKRDLLRVLKSLTTMSHALTRVITEADYSIEQYVAKGIIELHSIRTVEGLMRYLIIPKMRARPHYNGVVPFDITSEGIKIYTPDTKEFKRRVEKIKNYF